MSNRIDVEESVGRLHALSLTKRTFQPFSTISMHPLVHDWIHLRMEEDACRKMLENTMVFLFHKLPPLMHTHADRSVASRAEEIFVHLERLRELTSLYNLFETGWALKAECALLFLEAYLWYRGDFCFDLAESLCLVTEPENSDLVRSLIGSAKLLQVILMFSLDQKMSATITRSKHLLICFTARPPSQVATNKVKIT